MEQELQKSKYVCSVCGFVYDEASEGLAFTSLATDWSCPRCGTGKDLFRAAGQQKSVSGAKITRDMTIGELVQKYPSVVEKLQSFGVHCVGCGASYWETIEQGLGGHGMSDEQINIAVQELNQAIPAETGSSETLVITEKAAHKLKEILKSQNKENMGLRISVMPGGCSGSQYGFDFEEKANPDDTVMNVVGVNFFVDSQSLQMLRGSKVDYVDSLQNAGFKISNPNAHGTCGCGQSFN